MGKPADSITVPLLPLRDIVVFPEMVMPLFVGREKSIEAIERALKKDKRILLAAQRDPQVSQPLPDDIFPIGTLATVLQVVRLPDGMLKLLVEGIERYRIDSFIDFSSTFVVSASPYRFARPAGPQTAKLHQEVLEAFERYVQLSKKVAREVQQSVQHAQNGGKLADLIAGHLDLKVEQRQFLLEIPDPHLRLDEVLRVLRNEIEVLEVEQKIQQRVKEQMERNQREYFLNEQMKAIQSELGITDDARAELDELRDKIKNKALPQAVRHRAEQELKKLRMMTPVSAEATVVRNYLDWILAIPWLDERPLAIDLPAVRAILDEDHYGLKTVKERIVEFLAVRKLTDAVRGPKLCLVGPPGVGKTSLARSIARALGLEFVRQSLGGVRDEAEIRGHRRTYIGALPGRIVQGLRKVSTRNPVFLLDEIDKLASDFRGDPASALLEVLDPEQNSEFQDHYLDLDLDLSRVFFITTANTTESIPPPLLDRLEVIEIGSYTEDEKVEIAKRHLIPRQIQRHGLGDRNLAFRDAAIRAIVRHYTREAGVRNLERRIEALCRKLAVSLVDGELASGKTITSRTVRERLGTEKFRGPLDLEPPTIGVTQGLAWTEVGGQVLTTEATVMPGTGNLQITGKLGEVMQESARAALSYVRHRAVRLGIDPDFYKRVDIHVHVPEGAVPKDGPSAGITIATSLVSVLTGLAVRADTAMTGEITLRGRVLAVGGLKEKLLAAHRAGIARIIIPADSERELSDVPERARRGLTIILVADMDQVLDAALACDEPDGPLAYLARRGVRHPLPVRDEVSSITATGDQPH